MSASAMTGNVSPTAEPPPIAFLLPMLQSGLTGSSLLLRHGVRFLLTTLYPLRIVWSIIHVLLAPITTVLTIAADIVLFTPFSIIRMVAVALYPIYVFCAVACIFGTAVGIFGHYVSIGILSVLARSKYFTQSSNATLPTVPPSSPQITLRKRKRKTVRLQ